MVTSLGRAVLIGAVAAGAALAQETSSTVPGGDGGILGSPMSESRAPVHLGSLDKELIRRVIHQNRQQIRACYEKALISKPTLAGKLRVKFHISAPGTVSSAEIVDSTVADAELGDCVTARVSTWIFPKPSGGGEVIVTYPFVFNTSPASAPPPIPANSVRLEAGRPTDAGSRDAGHGDDVGERRVTFP